MRVEFAPPPAGSPPLTPWSVDLPSSGVTDVGEWIPHGFLQKEGCIDAPLELFSDGGGPSTAGYGLPMTVARWPNVARPSVPYSEWIDEASWDRAAYVRGEDTLNSSLYVSDDAPFANWTSSLSGGGVMFTGYPFFDWADGGAPAIAFNASSRLLSLSPGVLAYNVSFSAKYFLQNAREALDAPLEYWVDPDPAGGPTLYFIPPAGSVAPLYGWVSNASSQPALLSISGAAHVAFVNFALSFSRGAGASIVGSDDVTLLNVTVVGVGGSGVSVLSSTGVVVAGANVSHTGGSGISSYGGGSRRNLTSSGLVVVDSTVLHVGRRCLSYAGGITLDSIGAVSAFNAITGTPHIGSNVASNDGLFEYNVVTNTVLAACDMGAFYAGAADWSVWNATVRYSAFYLTGYAAAGCNMQSGTDIGDVYFDEVQSGVRIYGNVHWNPNPPHVFSYLSKQRKTYAHIINGGSHAQVGNSLVVDANISYFNSISGLASDYHATVCSPNGSYIGGMRAMAWNEGTYAAHYPELAALQAGCDSGVAPCAQDATCPAAPFACSVTNMVLVNVTTPVFLAENASVFDPSNFNISGQWVGLEPGFQAGSLAAARASLNFQLAPDSPVYADLPGFREIPIACMGPYACPNLTVPYPRAAGLWQQFLFV